MPEQKKKKSNGTRASSRSNSKSRAKTKQVKEQSSWEMSVSGIAAAVMVASALLFLLDIFGVDAVLIGAYANLMKGLLGVGYFVLPFCLLWCAWELVVTSDQHRRKSQWISLLLFPMLIGAWGHLFTVFQSAYVDGNIGKLYTDGTKLKAGGILAGLVADGISYLISPYGLAVLLLICTFIMAVYMVKLRLRDVVGHLFDTVRDKSSWREDRRVVREEERRAEWEETRRKRQEEWERKQEYAPVPAESNPVNPSDFNLPLDKERPRPKGVFKNHEEPAEEPGGEFPFPMAPEEEPIPVEFQVDPTTGEVVEEPTRKKVEPITLVDEPFVVPELDMEEPVIEPAPAPVLEPDPEPTPEPVEEGEEDEITDDMIYEYKEGDEGIMLDEVGINQADIEHDETKVSSNLRPSEAEKLRQAAEREKNAPPPYQMPPIDLLKKEDSTPSPASEEEIKFNARRLVETLASFNIDAKITNVIRGPSITRYEVQLKQGIRFSKLTSLSDDIALALAAQSVRIAAIPDKVSIGIEVPNKNVSTVYIRDCIESNEFAQNPSKVAFALGKDITGKVIAWDIAKLPHMLVAGTTGSGKSVCVNSLLISLLYKATPDEVKFIMIDPKIIELGVYNGIPHLMTPVVTDPKKAAGALQWAVYEMMRRYKQMADLGVRSVFEYNAEVERRHADPQNEYDPELKKLPQIVIVVDELADLMLSSPKEVEEAICRIAQMARAAGMHLIIATQRPSADVITGLMKANIPSRIAFSVSSALDSRIILDTQGAEKLIGKGDMLFSPIGATKAIRIQGCFISSSEIEAVCNHAKRFGSPEYDAGVLEHIEKASEAIGRTGKKNVDHDDDGDSSPDAEDPMLYEAIDVVMESQMASASGLQRRLKLGYTRAARLIDIMEEKGIVGPFQGSKPREILMSKDRWMEMKANRGE